MSSPFDEVLDAEESSVPAGRPSTGSSAARPGAAALQHRRRIEEYWEMRRLRDQIGDLPEPEEKGRRTRR